jgi:hypothetical protein
LIDTREETILDIQGM